MEVVYGSELSKELKEELAKEILKIEGRKPCLCVILVGEDPASKIYTRMKDRQAKKLGIHSVLSVYPNDVRQEEVLHDIRRFNEDEMINELARL